MKSLVCITSCNRLSEVKKYIWDYLQFINSDSRFHFLLALDGNEKEYLDFANKFDIPLLYSNEREGVGLSKNRVLLEFPNYDYYFFIEDDIELISPEIFYKVISAHQASEIHHFCNHHKKRVFKSLVVEQNSLQFSLTGGAQFAFYSKTGINKVGGFHTTFAKYKRYGHTEHSYRFYHQKLQNAPFVFSEDWLNDILIHSPPQVTFNNNIVANEKGLIKEEQLLIDNKSNYHELQTICSFYFNNKSFEENLKVSDFLKTHTHKYPLTKGKHRKIALAEHYALRISSSNNIIRKIVLTLKSIWFYPTNTALKHYLKTSFFEKQ